MTLAQLRYLVAIIEAGLNITEAATRVHATQSGMSQQLKLLEEELGFQIFVRRGRKLDRVTEAGIEVIESARLILAEAGNIDALAANRREAVAGDLRIFTTQTQAQYVLPPALAALRQCFPDVRVQLNLDAANPERTLTDATYDLAIVSAARPSFGDATAIALYGWTWRVLMPAGHPLAGRRDAVRLDELARYPLIGFESAAHRGGTINRAFADAGLAATIAYSAPDSEVIKAYVRSGLGIGLLPEMAARAEGPGEIALAVDERLAGSIAWAVVPPDRTSRDYVLDLLTRLAPHLSRHEIRRRIQAGETCRNDALPSWQSLSAPPPLRLAS